MKTVSKEIIDRPTPWRPELVSYTVWGGIALMFLVALRMGWFGE